MAISSASVQNFLHSPADTEVQTVSSGVRIITSNEVKTAFPFSSLFLSINCVFPAQSFVLLEAQVCVQKTWSPFYKIALLSRELKTSFPPQEDNFARIAIDEVLLKNPARSYRYRLHIAGGAEVTLLSSTVTKEPFAFDEKKGTKLPPHPFQIAVDPISQMEQKDTLRRRICSPASLCMALNSLGIPVPLKEVCLGVFDTAADIYGNWLFNVVYAANQGTTTYVRRFEQLAELTDFVTENSRVIASIAFGKHELTNAPLVRTTGHLMLIRGWEKGKILVADPAAPSAQTVCRAYDAREFARAWLGNKKGMAYIVRKK